MDIPFERIDAVAPARHSEKYPYRYVGEEKTTQDDEKRPKMGGKTTQDEIENPALKNLLKRDIIADKILEYCNEPRGIAELTVFLGIKERKNVRKHLHALIEQGRLAMTLPERPSSRYQKYITIQEK